MLTWYPDTCSGCRFELYTETELIPNPDAGKVSHIYSAKGLFGDVIFAQHYDHLLSDDEWKENNIIEYVGEVTAPDFLPSRKTLWDRVQKTISLCPNHQSVKDKNALTDDQIFKTVIQSCRAREYARYACKLELGLDKESVIPYRIEPDGSFTLGVDQLNNKMTQWPTAKRDLDKLRAVVNEAILTVERPIGTSEVKI